MVEKQHDPSPPLSPGAGDEASRWRAAFHEAIRDTARFARLLAVLSEPASPDRLLDRVLATLSELFAADIVVLLDPASTGSYVPLGSIGLPEETGPVRPFDSERGYLASVLARGEPILTEEAASDPEVDPRLRELGAQTAAFLSVTGSLSHRGALLLARCHPLPFTRADTDLLTAMSYRVGMAIEQMQRSAQLTRIERFGRDVGRYLDESAVAAEAARSLPAAVGAGAAVFVLRGPEGGHSLAACSGVEPGEAWCRVADYLSEGPDDPEPEVHALFSRLRVEPPHGPPIGAFMAIPIRRDERTQGFLFALRFSAAPFPPDSRQAATLFAGQTAAAIENARLYRTARDELAERKRAEAERARLEIQLQQSQRLEAIGTFAAGLAHDYNNLHLAVTGNLEIAREDMERGTDAFQAVEDALGAALQASELTRRFVTFTEGGAPVTETAPVRDLVADAVTLALAGSNVSVDYRFADGLWELEVDRLQVKQAIGAIVLNAREAMPGGGTIGVSAENVDSGPTGQAEGAVGGALGSGRFVAVTVTDRGHGIAPEDLPRIYDPYYSTKRRGSAKGMGLGLTMAHSVVRRHHGRIEVESAVGVGSTFRIYLPASLVLRPASAGSTRDSTPRPAGGARILLLEDEQAVAGTTIRMLRRLGFGDLLHSADGASAVTQFLRARDAGTPFSLAILDLTIRGGMGGKETMLKLREIDPGLRAIVASGYSEDPVMARHKEHGFRAALQKPFRLEELRQAIQEALA